MNTVILDKLRGFRLDDYQPIHRRELDLGGAFEPRRGNLVKVVTGMRRSGKSYRLFQEIGTLLGNGVAPDRIFYFNFEDDRLRPVTPHTGDEVIETIEALFPGALSKGVYLFLDELQEMQDWGSWMRRIVDTTKATIYVTGSSSKMLSREVATEFRGRAIDFELLPYSAKEWLALRHPDMDLLHPSAEERVLLRNSTLLYLERGGFPATVDLPEAQSVSLLQSYVERVVARDIIERHDVRRPRVATAFARRVLATNAMPLSIRKIEGDLRAAGLKTSRELLGELLTYLEETFLIFPVRQFTYSLAESTTSSQKVYAVDPGLALASARANTNALGQRLEDAVYLELRRRMPLGRMDAVSTYRTREKNLEVDFVVGDVLDQAVHMLFQVSADVSNARTLERELRALWCALAETDLDEATLITLDGEERVYERDGKQVRLAPAWKWFLEDAVAL